MKVDLSEIKGPGSHQGRDVREMIPGVVRDWGNSMPVVPNNTSLGNNTGLRIDIEDIRNNLRKLNEKQKRSILSSNIMKMVLL